MNCDLRFLCFFLRHDLEILRQMNMRAVRKMKEAKTMMVVRTLLLRLGYALVVFSIPDSAAEGIEVDASVYGPKLIERVEGTPPIGRNRVGTTEGCKVERVGVRVGVGVGVVVWMTSCIPMPFVVLGVSYETSSSGIALLVGYSKMPFCC